jgi:hypothetical protein
MKRFVKWVGAGLACFFLFMLILGLALPESNTGRTEPGITEAKGIQSSEIVKVGKETLYLLEIGNILADMSDAIEVSEKISIGVSATDEYLSMIRYYAAASNVGLVCSADLYELAQMDPSKGFEKLHLTTMSTVHCVMRALAAIGKEDGGFIRKSTAEKKLEKARKMLDSAQKLYEEARCSP